MMKEGRRKLGAKADAALEGMKFRWRTALCSPQPEDVSKPLDLDGQRVP